MMKKSVSAIIAGLLALVLVFTGCDRVTQELDQRFPETSEVEKDDPVVEDPLPERVRRTYTVLLTTQLEKEETLSGVSLLTFHTADDSLHWLELPPDLLIHATGNNLQGHFANAYRVEMVKESGTEASALRAGADALRKLISTGFNMPIDYWVNLDGEQLSDLVKKVGAIPMTLTEGMGGLAPGEYTLDAKAAMDFLTYTKYSDPATGKLNAHIQFAASFWQQARTVITADNLSLFSMEIRSMMTTDIPNTGGEDMFFLRKFLRAEPNAFAITHVTSQSVFYNGTQCRVLVKANALRQLNEQMMVYEDALTVAQFDPRGVFVDYANQMVATVYTTTALLPPLHTMEELLHLEPAPEPDEGEGETETES